MWHHRHKLLVITSLLAAPHPALCIAFQKPLVGFTATNNLLYPVLTQGWHARLCWSQGTQASIISAAMRQLSWTLPTMLRQAWGVQFRDEMKLFGTPIGAEYKLPCGTQACSQELPSPTNVYGEQLVTIYNRVRANVWILWGEYWEDNLAVLNRVGLVRAGMSFFVFSCDIPQNHALAQGLLAANELLRSTASYAAWHAAKFPSHTGQIKQITGLAYETAYLYAHALHQLSTEGTNFTDGTSLMAAIKSVTFKGVVHYNVKIGSRGESAEPYKLFNFYDGAWNIVGKWENGVLYANWGNQTAATATDLTGLNSARFFKSLTDTPIQIPPPGSANITVGVLVPRQNDTSAAMMLAALTAVNTKLNMVPGYYLVPILGITGDSTASGAVLVAASQVTAI